MADVNFDFSDLEKWEKLLVRYMRESPKNYKKFVRGLGNSLRRKARANTPKGPSRKMGKTSRKPGDLKKSYQLKMNRNYEVAVGTTKFYAKMVEEGHEIVKYTRTKRGRQTKRTKHVLGFVSGKSYFKKAVEETDREMKSEVKAIVTKVGRGMGFRV